MNARILSTLFSLFFSFPALLCQITLEECQQRAQENYPLVKRFSLISESTHLSLANATRSYWPQTSLLSSASYQSDVTHLPIQLPGLSLPVPDKDQYQITLEASQMVWDGGMTHSQKDKIRISAEVERKRLEADLYQIRSRINELYFGTLLLEEQIANNRLLQEDLERNLNRVEAFLRFGVATESDASELRVSLLESKQQADYLVSSRRAYLEMLEKFIGIPLPQGISMPPEIAIPKNGTFYNRPEYIALDFSQLRLSSERKVADAKIRPVLSLFARGGYGRPALNLFKNDFTFYYIGGIRLSWNISALYTYSNEKKLIETERKSLAVSKEVFLFNEEQRMTALQREWLAQNEMLRRDEEIIALRNQIFKSSESKLENGVIEVTDLLRDLTAENRARINRSSHRIQLLYTLYQMKYVTNE